MFDKILNDLLARLEGARCVLLAGMDGMIVAAAVARSMPAPDAVAASLVDLFRKLSVAHRDAGLAPPSEFTSGGAGGQAAVRTVTEDYVLIAVLEDASGLGRTRFELRKTAAAIQPELV